MDVFDLAATLKLDSSEYDQGLADAEGKASKFGSGLKTAAKVGAGAVAAVGTGIAALATGLVSQTGAVAEYGDNIDKMAQKMGMSREAYQEWDAVMQHSGTSMEAMKASMKTLANAAETDSDAFKELGITQEQIASMSQEELFEATITALQGVGDETKRTYLAGKTLGKGATELGALLNTSAEDTQAMRDRVHELGGVMSDEAVKAAAAYQDSMQDMQTAISGISRNLFAEFMPGITQVMNGITEIFAGNGSGGVELITEGINNVLSTLETVIPQVMTIAGNILTAFSQAIMENLPQIAESGTQIIMNLVTALISNLPQILETGIQVVATIAQGIMANIPALLIAIINAITQLIATIGSNLPQFLQKGYEMLSQMGSGIVQNVPAILSAMLQALMTLVSTIASNLPQFLSKGIEIIGKIAAGIIQGVPALIGQIPGIIQQIVSSFLSFNWLSVGGDIIRGIASGVMNAAGALWDAVKSVASGALGAVTGLLGIGSPSKVFRDKVGRWIPEGEAEGIRENADVVTKAVEDMNRGIAGAIQAEDLESTVTVRREEVPGVNQDSRILAVLQEVLEVLDNMNNGLYEKISMAVDDIGFEIDSREFGRLVRDVRI